MPGQRSYCHRWPDMATPSPAFLPHSSGLRLGHHRGARYGAQAIPPRDLCDTAAWLPPRGRGFLAGESKSRIMQVGPIGSGGHRRALTAAQTGRSDRAVVTKSGWRDRGVGDTSILNHPILSCAIIYNQRRQTGAAQASHSGAKRLESLENLVEMCTCVGKGCQRRGEGSINGHMDKKGAGGGKEVMVA